MHSNATPERPQPSESDPVVAEIWHTLAGLGDADKAARQQAYMKSEIPFRGLSSPELQATLRPILASWVPPSRASWEASIRKLWDNVAFRDEWYAGLSLLRHPAARGWLDAETLPLLRHLITTGAWWDVVDALATHPLREALVADTARVTPIIRKWATDDDLWIRRSAVLCQIGRGPDLDRALLVEAIEATMADTSFWLRKAIGWALRDHARHDPEWVREQVEAWGGALSGLSRREALKRLAPRP